MYGMLGQIVSTNITLTWVVMNCENQANNMKEILTNYTWGDLQKNHIGQQGKIGNQSDHVC